MVVGKSRLLCGSRSGSPSTACALSVSVFTWKIGLVAVCRLRICLCFCGLELEPDHRRACTSRQQRREPRRQRQRLGTAALLELARSYATPQAPPRPPEPITRSCSCPRTEGRSEASERRISRSSRPTWIESSRPFDLDSIAGNGRPHLVFAGDDPRFAAPALVRTAAARVLEQTGTPATRPGAFAQPLDLAFPLSLYEQAPFVGANIAAIALTSAGDRPPPAVGDTVQQLNAKRLTGIGRSSQALLGSLDMEVEVAEGTSAYVYLGARTVRGWAIVLILFTALLPCLAVIVDLFARLRRRHIPLAPALRSFRSRLLFSLFAALLFEAFIYLGAWQTGAARPLATAALDRNGLAGLGLAVFTLPCCVSSRKSLGQTSQRRRMPCGTSS